MKPHRYGDAVTLYHGDCLDVLRELPDASVDSVVTDPPYGLGFMGKEWDSGKSFVERKPAKRNTFDHVGGNHNPTSSADAARTRRVESARFGAWCELWAAECLRVLKPGGHLLAFGGSRTWHRLACAVEDAGFEIRDSIAWLYGSGFPKSLDVSKAIDKRRDWTLVERLAGEIKRARAASGLSLADMGEAMLAATDGTYGKWYHRGGHMFFETGRSLPSRPEWEFLSHVLPVAPEFVDVYDEAERDVTGQHAAGNPIGTYEFKHGEGNGRTANERRDIPATPDAERWLGWGTALKPAFEPVVVARKPLAGTVSANVLAHGTGALNIDATRIGTPLDSAGSSRGDSTSCTCHEPAGDRTSHSESTQLRASSDASPEGRSALPASAPQGETSCPRPQGSPGDCPSSPCSCGERAQSEAAVARASAQPPRDALAPGVRQGVGTRNPRSQSKPCPHCTACNVERRDTLVRPAIRRDDNTVLGKGLGVGTQTEPAGRWPANVVLDESQAAELDQQSGTLTSGTLAAHHARTPKDSGILGAYGSAPGERGYGDEGGASRFFYVAKADASERPRVDGVAHPTVKPLALMRWLVRLVTPPGGTVLEPFAGSGTTVEACIVEGFQCVAIEREADYLPLIEARIARRRDPVRAIELAQEDAGLFALIDEEESA